MATQPTSRAMDSKLGQPCSISRLTTTLQTRCYFYSHSHGLKTRKWQNWVCAQASFTPDLCFHVSTALNFIIGVGMVAQMIKNPPLVQETWVQPLGQEDPLEEGMATHSSILAWRVPWTEEPGELQCIGSQRVRHN